MLLDLARDDSLVEEYLAREFINRVQRLRKKAGLNPTDVVNVNWKVVSDNSNEFDKVMDKQLEFLTRNLKRAPVKLGEKDGVPQDRVIAQEQLEIQDISFMLTLVKLED